MFEAFRIAANSTTAGKEGSFDENFCCNNLMYKFTVSMKPTGLPCHPEPPVMFSLWHRFVFSCLSSIDAGHCVHAVLKLSAVGWFRSAPSVTKK